MVLSDYLEEEINEDEVLSRINTSKGRRDYNEAAEKIDEIRLTQFQERHLQEVDPISESDKLEIIRYAKEYLRLKDGAKATHFAKVVCSVMSCVSRNGIISMCGVVFIRLQGSHFHS